MPRCRIRGAVGIAVALVAMGGCRTGAELPDSWRRVGVGHGSIVVSGEMRTARQEIPNKLCIGRIICGTERMMETGKEGELPVGVGPDPTRAKRPEVSIERTQPLPGVEVVFQVDNSLASWILAREGTHLVALEGMVAFSPADSEERRELRELTGTLAGSWRGGPQQCEPDRVFLASGSFADRPSTNDSADVSFRSTDGQTGLGVSLWHAPFKDSDAYLRRHLLAHRFSIPFIRAFARLISLGRSDLARSMRRDLRETPIREYIRVIRRRSRTVGDMRGAEIVYVPRPDEGESPTMIMQWGYAGKPGDPDRPSAHVGMAHPYDRKTFRKVLRQWDRIVPTLQARRHVGDACVNAASRHGTSG